MHDYFVEWHCDGTLTRIHHALYSEARELAGKQATATTAIVDSQSVKSAEKGGPRIDASGYDAGKKIKGKKRHAVVDTLGLMVGLAVSPGDIQDRDMIAPRSFGLETCPQAAFLIFHDVLQKRLGIPAEQTIVCGMALGYPDMTDQVNTFAPDRMPVRDFVTFVEKVERD